MFDLIVLGTDTDAGKTTFALLWLSAFREQFAYWKPVETGPSDTELSRRLVPGATVHEPLARLTESVAPPLAARREGRSIPAAIEIVAAKPPSHRPLLIETFGGPLSPLNESELQIEFIRRLGAACVLVTSSAVGAVGRALTTLRTLRSDGVSVGAIVLVGPRDDYAEEQIQKHGAIPTRGLRPPTAWVPTSIEAAAAEQRDVLNDLIEILSQEQRVPSEDLLSRDRRHVWHPYTSLRDPASPLPVVAACDEFLELADGRRVIDGISSWWTILHGHRHPRLMDALRRASEQIDHVHFAGVTHPFAVEYAEELLKTTPWPGGRVFFSDNGSTAVEVALKMAYQAWCHQGEPQRTLFIGFEGGYHGDTFGAMAVGCDPLFFGRFAPMLFRAERIPVSPEQLEDVLKHRASEVAAVIIEPLIQGAGGMRMHTPDVLRDLFDVAKRHGILVIADEVMTGGRTGSFWAHSQARIAPDIVCAAKTLAGGVLPLAVSVCCPGIVDAFDTDDRARTFFHGHSFTAHPLACAVAVENLRMMTQGDWHIESDRIHRFWQVTAARLRELPAASNVRVFGTILALDVGERAGYLADVAPRMRAVCLERNVLLRPLGNVLYALPPLCTSDESLARIAEAMRAAVLAAGS
jgi:adenosylmethionine-8-amino-7-oxononanoate aminotransferase